MIKFSFILLSLHFVIYTLSGQYAPAAGTLGSTAIYMDSSVFTSWATQSVLNVGWMNLADTSLGKANFGDAFSPLGKADNDVVSLGDGGEVILTFDFPITDGPSWDFAVFENSFDGHYLELAFVEVSSDGQNFFRFPAHSLTDNENQVQAFDTISTMKINNLAGKYKGGWGTPFDLQELSHILVLDISAITHVRIMDVVGSIDSIYANLDSAGNAVNDPWPTAFSSSGFDLDAVGVIHQSVGFKQIIENESIRVFPNPASDFVNLDIISGKHFKGIELFDGHGKFIKSFDVQSSNVSLNISDIPKGFYLIKCKLVDGNIIFGKLLIQ